MMRLGEPPVREGRECSVEPYRTDARVLHYSDAGVHASLNLVDASHAHAQSDERISVSASEPITDLHVAFRDDAMDVRATAPPSELRLRGTPLRRIQTMRVNGRELPVGVLGAATVLVDGGHWGDGRSHAPAGDCAAADPLLLST
jgi:hypothetical protein